VEPTDTAEVDAPGFRLIEQTLEQIMPQAVVLPYIMVGGTDSRHYSGLCANIYRFTPYTLSDQDLKGIHGTDERLSLDNLDRMIRFLTHFIRQGVSG
jgi:carboxypeptidase PM20D1